MTLVVGLLYGATFLSNLPLVMPLPSATGEVYCFPRHQPIFFHISESFFELVTIFQNNSGVWLMHARRGRHLC